MIQAKSTELLALRVPETDEVCDSGSDQGDVVAGISASPTFVTLAMPRVCGVPSLPPRMFCHAEQHGTVLCMCDVCTEFRGQGVAVACDPHVRLLVGATNTQPSGCLSWEAGGFHSAGGGAYMTRVHGCGGCGSV